MSTCTVHMPEMPDNYVGVEIEFLGDRRQEDDINKALGELRSRCVLNWEWHGAVTGFEIKMLLLCSEYVEYIPRIVEVLRPFAATHPGCGLHVHLDMRNRNKAECFKKLFHAQDRLFAMCAPHRDHGRVNGEDITKHGGNAFMRGRGYDTLEVRMHESTFDAEKIVEWVDTLHEVIGEPRIVKAA